MVFTNFFLRYVFALNHFKIWHGPKTLEKRIHASFSSRHWFSCKWKQQRQESKKRILCVRFDVNNGNVDVFIHNSCIWNDLFVAWHMFFNGIILRHEVSNFAAAEREKYVCVCGRHWRMQRWKKLPIVLSIIMQLIWSCRCSRAKRVKMN